MVTINEVFDLHPRATGLEIAHNWNLVAGDAPTLSPAQYAELSQRLGAISADRNQRGPIGSHHRVVG